MYITFRLKVARGRQGAIYKPVSVCCSCSHNSLRVKLRHTLTMALLSKLIMTLSPRNPRDNENNASSSLEMSNLSMC